MRLNDCLTSVYDVLIIKDDSVKIKLGSIYGVQIFINYHFFEFDHQLGTFHNVSLRKMSGNIFLIQFMSDNIEILIVVNVFEYSHHNFILTFSLSLVL